MIPERWEHGSDFHRVDLGSEPSAVRLPWADARLCGSGRDALRMLVDHGVRQRGWKRLWVPAYLCQEVVAALEALPIVIYDDLPDRALAVPDTIPGDAVLVVNTFGLRAGPSPDVPPGVDLVEDHTHDPVSSWARTSRADFAVASLRKTLPLPEGGVLWSPAGAALPASAPLSDTRAAAARARREAMALKARYLEGDAVDKPAYRRLALAGEAGIAAGPVSAMTPESAAELPRCPMDRWREQRGLNFDILASRLSGVPDLRVLRPEDKDCVPFSVVLVARDPGQRTRIREHLIARQVYPAILWPLEDVVAPVPDAAVMLSRRLLSLHCDFRYTREDLDTVAAIVEEAARQ